MAKAKPVTGLNCQEATGKNARLIAMLRLDEMYQWAEYVDHPYDVAGLHNLRIAAKRVRYTLEVFEDTLPEACKPIVNELTQLQDELGTVHDSDVMIAMLRLCLASQSSGSAYEHALARVEKHPGKDKLMVPPELLAKLLDPATAPSDEARFGLEHLLQQRLQRREDEYKAFRQHWERLQEQDFRRKMLETLNA